MKTGEKAKSTTPYLELYRIDADGITRVEIPDTARPLTSVPMP